MRSAGTLGGSRASRRRWSGSRTIETLGEGIDRLAGLMDRLLASIETLDGNVGSLRASLEPIGRIADRVPGNRRTG